MVSMLLDDKQNVNLTAPELTLVALSIDDSIDICIQ